MSKRLTRTNSVKKLKATIAPKREKGRLVRTNSIEGFGKLSPQTPVRRKRSGSIIQRQNSLKDIGKVFKVLPAKTVADPTDFPEYPLAKPWNPDESLTNYLDRVARDRRAYQLRVEAWRQRWEYIDSVETCGEWVRRIDPECGIRSEEILLAMWKKRAIEIWSSQT